MKQDTKYALLDDIELDFHALLAYDDAKGMIGLPVNVEFLSRHGYVERQDRPIAVASSGLSGFGGGPTVSFSPNYVLTIKGRQMAQLLVGSGAQKIIAIKEILDSLEKDDDEKVQL
jgi:hypothetical protein